MLAYKQLLVVLALLSVSLLSIRGTSHVAKQLGEYRQQGNGVIGNSTNLTTHAFSINATLRERMLQNGMPKNPRIYFIHIGKAGGVTLRKKMGLLDKIAALPCRMKRTRDGEDDASCYKPKSTHYSEFNKHILCHFHMLGNNGYSKEQKQWLLNNTNTFLYIIRDPIDRIISAYNYHKNEN